MTKQGNLDLYFYESVTYVSKLGIFLLSTSVRKQLNLLKNEKSWVEEREWEGVYVVDAN